VEKEIRHLSGGAWYYSPDHGQLCQVIETQTLWGETTCRVWLPGRDSVVRIPASRLKSLESAGTGSPDDIAYIAAAARVADALTQDVLLAPIESSVIPLPHQIRALSRAIANDRVRYLLADEVGLGKTIEAGLIMRELKLRGLVKRTLVIAPKGLVSQWVSEMRFHFGETFQLVLPEDIKTLKRIAPVTGPGNGEKGNPDLEVLPANAWQMFSQVVVPMDSVKPLDKRRGWSAAQVSEHNRERFEDLISAGWDLVIVDEAHRLGGSTDQVARFKLGQGLAEAAPYFLMLSATPHQGKTDAFHRLVSLIDAQEFPDISSVTRERVQPHVIRTEKRRAIDADGKPLFKPRRTQLAPVSWEERHRNQQLLYEAVTEYVREGYNQAMREKRSYIGFLMILMQRLVVSSTSAIKTTLERRLTVLSSESRVPSLFDELATQNSELETFYDLDGQEQIDVLLRTRLKALKNERAEVKLLLEAAARCEQIGPDAKAEALLDWLYRLQSEESDPELKALVFTEFVPTQEMLRRFLTERGFSVVCLNGSMDMEERKRVQEAFAKDVRILISTDAGGEGLNLQFCHVVINYDIPWNPMRLEQRTGRGIDRIYEGMLRYGRPAPDYAMSDSSSVVLQLSRADADTAFLEMILSYEQRTGAPMPIDSLIVLARLCQERRLTITDLIQSTQKSEPATRATLEKLVEAGLVEAQGTGRGRSYILSAKVYKKSGQKAAYVRQMGFDPIQQEQMVLTYIDKHGSIKRSDVMDLCRLTKDQAYKLLNRLKNSGQINQIGSRKGAVYERKR
jgi:SNF2 family DNA or RNA helicase/DNA-binding transcriptional ArsR family regulator